MSEENAERDFEAEAGTMGWVPAEAFKGDPDKHQTAQEFVERGETRVPILVANQKKLTSRVQELQSTLAYQAEHNEKMLKQQNDRLRAEHEVKMQEAVKEGDEEAYLAAKKNRDDVVDPAPAKAPVAQDPAVTDFIDENPWFNSDDAMTAYANSESSRLQEKYPGLTVAQNLARVKASVETRFANDLGNGRRSEPATVSGGRKPGKAAKRGYNDLPQDAKDACTRFHKDGVFGPKTSLEDAQKQYLSTYEWSE